MTPSPIVTTLPPPPTTAPSLRFHPSTSSRQVLTLSVLSLLSRRLCPCPHRRVAASVRRSPLFSIQHPPSPDPPTKNLAPTLFISSSSPPPPFSIPSPLSVATDSRFSFPFTPSILRHHRSSIGHSTPVSCCRCCLFSNRPPLQSPSHLRSISFSLSVVAPTSSRSIQQLLFSVRHQTPPSPPHLSVYPSPTFASYHRLSFHHLFSSTTPYCHSPTTASPSAIKFCR